jgi:hypothetical protein
MSRTFPVADFPRGPGISRRRPVRFHSRRFGRRMPFKPQAQPVRATRVSDDLRLFAATFAGGFLFVSVLIA